MKKKIFEWIFTFPTKACLKDNLVKNPMKFNPSNQTTTIEKYYKDPNSSKILLKPSESKRPQRRTTIWSFGRAINRSPLLMFNVHMSN